MMDITTDGFGWMLSFGDLVFVPLTYTVSTRYLVWHSPPQGLWLQSLALAVFLVGYAIFRLSNNQKNAFRTDPNGPATRRMSPAVSLSLWGFCRMLPHGAGMGRSALDRD